MPEIGEMRNTPSLLSLSGPLWPGVVALDWARSVSQIEQNSNYAKTELFKIKCFSI